MQQTDKLKRDTDNEGVTLIVYIHGAHVASVSVVKKIYDGNILPPHELLTR